MSKRAKKGEVRKIKSVETWAPVWTDTNQFHLHPTVDKRTTRPPDEDYGGRTMTWVPVRIVPITKPVPKPPKAGKRKGKK